MKTGIRSLRIFSLMILCLTKTFVQAQNCGNLQLKYQAYPSLCLSTGSIIISSSGGSGKFSYKISGAVNSAFVSSAGFQGLPAGKYSVTVKDNVSGCTKTVENIEVKGSYSEPRFDFQKVDETCKNAKDGAIRVVTISGGRKPIQFSIFANSPNGISRTNRTGSFDKLPPGDYTVEIVDSCGAIQTKKLSLSAYDWHMQNPIIKALDCKNIEITIPLADNRGRSNSDTSVFRNFRYGAVFSGDTLWSSSPKFTYPLQKKKRITLIAKDGCGNTAATEWESFLIPSADEKISVEETGCSKFIVSVTGHKALQGASFCLYDQRSSFKTCNSSGRFENLSPGSYRIEIRSNCYDSIIIREFSLNKKVPSIDSSVRITSLTCSTHVVVAAGLQNFRAPQFTLYRGNTPVSDWQSSPEFYVRGNGNYCIRVKDGCYDTVLVKCFSISGPRPSIGEKLKIIETTCSDATFATDSIKNLSNAQFCLSDQQNNILECNNTGIFRKIPFGKYNLTVTTDKNCYDTIIKRVFDIRPFPPSADAAISVTRNCSTINLRLSGQRLSDPEYFLYDAANRLVQSNQVGVFNNLSYGQWCIRIKNNPLCFDTIITRCVVVRKNVPSAAGVSVTRTICSNFTASLSGNNLSSPKFVLKNTQGVVIDSNSTGVFTAIPNGSYCIELRNDKTCYDTTIIRCFTAESPLPVLGSPVYSDMDCRYFSVSFSLNLSIFNPVYYILNDKRDTLAKSRSGKFSNLEYGRYCVVVYDTCSQQKLEKCFTWLKQPIEYTLNAVPGCLLNTSSLRIRFSTGRPPFEAKVFDPVNNLLASYSTRDTALLIPNLPEISGNAYYRVTVSDSCGRSDTRLVTPVVAGFNVRKTFKAYCPEPAYKNGYSDLIIELKAKSGTVNPMIIRKDDKDILIHSTRAGEQHIFSSLEPARYILKYDIPSSCSLTILDTVIISPYELPSATQSAAYTCDNANTSVGITVKGGASPFTYQIIGSVPDTPVIQSVNQPDPIFHIPYTATYSLIRTRAIDGCGNAALSDVAILPLADIAIESEGNCFLKPTKLYADSVPQSQNRWYRLINGREVFVQKGLVLEIPYLLPSDTGIYILEMSINKGCLVRKATYQITGDCSIKPPVKKITLSARTLASTVDLEWIAEEETQIQNYYVERQAGINGGFETLDSVKIKPGQRINTYHYSDPNPSPGNNYYRIMIRDPKGNKFYSNTVSISWINDQISFYPNPVIDLLNIRVTEKNADYKTDIFTPSGSKVFSGFYSKPLRNLINIPFAQFRPGLYLVKVTNLKSGQSISYRIIKK